MTPTECELYLEETYQYCGVANHVAKIYWWVSKQPNQHRDISQTLTALTLDNTIIETE